MVFFFLFIYFLLIVLFKSFFPYSFRVVLSFETFDYLILIDFWFFKDKTHVHTPMDMCVQTLLFLFLRNSLLFIYRGIIINSIRPKVCTSF